MKQDRLISSRTVPCCLLSLLALVGFAHAQNQTINGDLTVTNGFKTGTTGTGGGMELRLGGLMIAKGTLNSSPVLDSTDQGAGVRLLWHPRKAAFRAGGVTGNHWNDASIGSHSIAFGYNTTASGTCSTAMGSSSQASGFASTAMGENNQASGYNSTAIGYGNQALSYYSTAIGELTSASGPASTAMGGYTSASGQSSTAMGENTYASGLYSTAMGYNTTAIGWQSTAMGFGTTTTGGSSTAMGYFTTATGGASTAVGRSTFANARSSLATGEWNIGGGNPTSWVLTDPLFEIGNGTSSANRRNAVTVYKNGNMDVQGAITCAPGGDIPMFGE